MMPIRLSGSAVPGKSCYLLCLLSALIPGIFGRCPRSVGFQTCRIADFQIGSARKLQRPLSISGYANLEIRDTADLEVGATGCVDSDGREICLAELRCLLL
jgi:hypothetical protein